jgi:integrase
VAIEVENSLVVAYDRENLIDLVISGLGSDHSRRSYRKSITDFLSWYAVNGEAGFSKVTVQAFKRDLLKAGLSASTVNQRLAAVRALAREAGEIGLIDERMAVGVARVKGVKAAGVRSGNWLSRDQAQALINLPDLMRLKGIRDRAILTVLIGAGLRRSEVAGLTFEHIQQREGRWVISDLVGKGNRVRSVPIPSWVKVAIDDWALAAGICTGKLLPLGPGRVFRPVSRAGVVCGAELSSQAIQDVVKKYSRALGVGLAAHDLRRTFAKLAYKGGAGIDQIQLSLGHASIKTTERYLGVLQDLNDAPCDHLGLRIAEK